LAKNENTDQAIAKAQGLTKAEVIEYTVAPVFMTEKKKEPTNG
jgi:hypothetical protein